MATYDNVPLKTGSGDVCLPQTNGNSVHVNGDELLDVVIAELRAKDNALTNSLTSETLLGTYSTLANDTAYTISDISSYSKLQIQITVNIGLLENFEIGVPTFMLLDGSTSPKHLLIVRVQGGSTAYYTLLLHYVSNTSFKVDTVVVGDWTTPIVKIYGLKHS